MAEWMDKLDLRSESRRSEHGGAPPIVRAYLPTSEWGRPMYAVVEIPATLAERYTTGWEDSLPVKGWRSVLFGVVGLIAGLVVGWAL